MTLYIQKCDGPIASRFWATSQIEISSIEFILWLLNSIPPSPSVISSSFCVMKQLRREHFVFSQIFVFLLVNQEDKGRSYDISVAMAHALCTTQLPNSY